MKKILALIITCSIAFGAIWDEPEASLTPQKATKTREIKQSIKTKTKKTPKPKQTQKKAESKKEITKKVKKLEQQMRDEEKTKTKVAETKKAEIKAKAKVQKPKKLLTRKEIIAKKTNLVKKPKNQKLFKSGTAHLKKGRYPDAIRELDFACKENNAKACYNLALAFERTKKTIDAKNSLYYFQKACRLDSSMGCGEVADALKNSTNEKQKQNAYVYYKIACEQNDAVSCVGLANLYTKNTPLKKDIYKAIQYYDKACDMGHANGCIGAGVALDSLKNYEEAGLRFIKGCELKDGNSCAFLGHMYEFGKGTKKSSAKAKKCYAQACEYGNVKACKYTISDSIPSTKERQK